MTESLQFSKIYFMRNTQVKLLLGARICKMLSEIFTGKKVVSEARLLKKKEEMN